MHKSSWVTAFFMIGFVAGFAALYLILDSYLKKISYHHLGALFCILAVGIAIMIYRLLRGLCSRQVKYYHLLLNLIGAGLLGVGYYFAGDMEEPGKLIHRTPSFILMFGVVAQVLFTYSPMNSTLFITKKCFYNTQILGACFVFVLMGGTQARKIRTYFAPFHDIFGLWIYLSLAVIYLVAINRDVRSGFDTETPKATLVWINTVCYLTFLVPIFVVLCPYMEWELVGPI